MYQKTAILDGGGMQYPASTEQAQEDWALVGKLRATPELQAFHTVPLWAVPTLFLLIGCYVAFGLSTYGMVMGWMPMPLGVLINAFAIYASFTVFHDGTHYACSGNKIVNEVIGTLGGQLLFPGFAVSVYREFHLAHHKWTGEHDNDPDDFATRSLPVYLVSGLILEVVWVTWYLKRLKQWPIATNARVFFGLSLYASFIVFFLSSPWGVEWLYFWLIPQRLGIYILLYVFTRVQHPPGVEQRHYPIHATGVLRPNRVLGPMMLGQAAHLMHHLYPQIPWYRLEATWQATKSEFSKRAPTYRSYLSGWDQNAFPTAKSHWHLVKVVATEDIAQDIRLFTLESANHSPLPCYEAGAHIDVRLENNLVRQYSLIGLPGKSNRWQIAVKRDAGGRGGSIAVHERLQPGTTVEVGGPRNHFHLEVSSGRHVLIAGGIGVTPLISMAYALENRDFALHVFARTSAHVPFGRTIQSLPFAARIQQHCDDGKGFEDSEILSALGQYRVGDQMYLCGPAGFMERIQTVAATAGWPASAIATENFGGAPSHHDVPFTIELAHSGRQLQVGAGESIVDVLEASRVSIHTVCRRGVCGTCRCQVISGEIEHRDSVLTAAERKNGNQILPCVSRGTGKSVLVLDL